MPSVAELEAATTLHHQLFTGLILGLAGHHSQDLAARFVEETFRRQHDGRFVPGLETLGLARLPAAVACARFIVLANRAGGLDVHYHEESDCKAWVHYPPPRWAYEGPSICALDNRVSEAFMRGFHARCGPSMDNPRLRFVCTGMTTNGDPGLTGYFEECDTVLADDSRLAFRLDEPAPVFRREAIPPLPWSDERLPLARRNYAVRYIAIMLPVMLDLLGEAEGEVFATRMCRLVGLQAYRRAAQALGIAPGGRERFMAWLRGVNAGTGNRLSAVPAATTCLSLDACRLGERHDVFRCWSGLFAGAAAAHDPRLRLAAAPVATGWTLEEVR